MNKADITFLLRTLKDRYPDVKTQLVHKTPFQLLTATILSAQCTDRQVNLVTQKLFARFPDPAALAQASLADIKMLIYSTGFYNNKAKNIKACALALLERHNGQVPHDLDLLVKLPGVGRKTANVVRSAVFGLPAIVVDTHVLRISGRLGLTKSRDPVKVEFGLMKIIPESAWSDLSLQFIYFGREICDARKPLCSTCPLFDICVFPGKG